MSARTAATGATLRLVVSSGPTRPGGTSNPVNTVTRRTPMSAPSPSPVLYSTQTPTHHAALVSSYTDSLHARRLRPYTIEQRGRFARRFLTHWGLDVAGHTVGAWLNTFDGWTAVTYYGHACSWFSWLAVHGHIGDDPTAVLRRPTPPRPRARPLSDRELAAAVEAASGDDASFLMLGYLAGLRAHEIAKFHGRDIDDSRIHVVGKGGQSEMVPAHSALVALAATYPRDDYWFPSPMAGRAHLAAGTVSDRVSRLFTSLGIAGSSHRARHTYGTRLLRGGANLRVVQDLMRHRDLTTTAGYLGTDELERVRAIRGLEA